jgi:hypothetical protein
MVNVLFRIFGSIATAVLTAVLVASLSWHGAPAGAAIADGSAPVHFLVKAFSDGFLVMAGFALIGLILSFFVRDRVLDEPMTFSDASAPQKHTEAIEV